MICKKKGKGQGEEKTPVVSPQGDSDHQLPSGGKKKGERGNTPQEMEKKGD